jgi:hypothetical protein
MEESVVAFSVLQNDLFFKSRFQQEPPKLESGGSTDRCYEISARASPYRPG